MTQDRTPRPPAVVPAIPSNMKWQVCRHCKGTGNHPNRPWEADAACDGRGGRLVLKDTPRNPRRKA